MADKVRFLDLDAVNKPLGTVKLDGAEYEVMPMSLEALINLSVLGDEIDETADQNTQRQQIDTALGILRELVPAVPGEKLRKLSIGQLNALVAWANEMGTEQATKNSVAPRRRRGQRTSTSRS